jgi:hypothetical protein
VPLSALLVVGMKTQENAGARMYAREIASSEIDRVKSMDFNGVGINSATKYYSSASTHDGDQIRQDNGYLTGLTSRSIFYNGNLRYTIDRDVRKYIDSSTQATMKKVIITVTWDQPAPGGNWVQLTTLLGPVDMSTS